MITRTSNFARAIVPDASGCSTALVGAKRFHGSRLALRRAAGDSAARSALKLRRWMSWDLIQGGAPLLY